MKKHFFVLVLLTTASILSYGQANTALSNLISPTTINVDLRPNSNNSHDLGSISRSWRRIYLDSAIYLKDSLFMHMKGSYNAFVGFQAGKSITSGISNAALGYNALTANTTGSQNTALGWSALTANTSGSNNTALGKAVLYTNIDGSFNSGSGYQALFYNWHGNNNTASGAYSLFQNINGSENTAIGFNSMRLNQTGGLNSAFGENALYTNTTGGYNTASGVNALFNSTSGFANVAIGFQAGYNITDGQYNVYLGTNADGSAHLTNTVALGANVKATKSNTIILGTNQNVGIGTTNPTYRLSVNGTIQAKELRVETGWSDYVFEKNYPLLPLEKVAEYIKGNKHLPGINSAKDIQQNGLAVADMQTKMMAKIEELTLYVIDLQQQIKELKKSPEVKALIN